MICVASVTQLLCKCSQDAIGCKRTYMGPIENDLKYLFWNLQWCLLQVTNLLLNQLLCGGFTQLPVLAQEETCVRTL